MEQASFQPRNLAPSVAAWLRTLGFTARETEHPEVTTVEAHWLAPDGKFFYVDYEHYEQPAPEALLHMTVYLPGVLERQLLIRGQRVRRLQQVRQLVVGDQVFHASRQLLPAPATP